MVRGLELVRMVRMEWGMVRMVVKVTQQQLKKGGIRN